jgi:hypothetical protein
VKPHQLAIEAFGPYADPVAIDFDALAAEGLFLIHGTTGAGKTFLLDALCFALYGEVSGERSVKGLRSDHAPATAVPRVTLEFSAAGERWRVERSPACTLPKQRGSGPARVELLQERLAHEHRVDPRGLEPLDVAPRLDPAFGHEHHVVGHPLPHRQHVAQVGGHRLQVAIVDAHERGPEVEHAREILLVV